MSPNLAQLRPQPHLRRVPVEAHADADDVVYIEPSPSLPNSSSLDDDSSSSSALDW